MRSTVTLDDDIATALKETARKTGRTFKATVNDTLRAGLRAMKSPPTPKPYELQPARLGATQTGIDLDKALQLAEALEDEAIVWPRWPSSMAVRSTPRTTTSNAFRAYGT